MYCGCFLLSSKALPWESWREAPERVRVSSRNKKHSDNISPDKGRCISLCRYFMETGLPSPSHSVTLPGLRLPASASLPLASCWPRPQQLLPVSATGGGRRRCSQREGLRVGLIQLFQRFDHTLIFLLYRREQLVGTVKLPPRRASVRALDGTYSASKPRFWQTPSGCERHGMLSGHPSLPAPFSGSGSCRPAEISERSGGRSPRWADAPSRPCNRRQWLHILVPTSFLYLTQEQFRQREFLFSGEEGHRPQSPPRAGLLRRAGTPAAAD